MNPLPVSARRLCRRALRTQDCVIPAAWLLPFFDRAGSVQAIMLLTSESGDICLLPWRPGLINVPVWGPISLAGHGTSIRAIADEQFKKIELLWHFDPWWVLAADRYAAHRAVGPLKATNCAGRLRRKVKMVYYRRDLSRLSSVRIRTRNGIEIESWKRDLLLASKVAPAPAPIERAPPAWRLDPIWKLWTAR